MIQINPLQSYIDGGARAAIVSPPSASLVFDLPGKAIWVKGVKLKGTDHTYTFSHDNYISLTNTPGSSESEDILIGINTTLLKQAIDTTYGVVSASADGLAPMFSSANTASASAATTYNFLGITGTSLKWFQLPWRNVRINADTTDKLGVNDTDPLIISSGDGISVTWDSTGKKIVITNSAPDQNHNTDSSVAQIRNTQNKNYPLILKGGTGSDGIISSVNFNESITYNPSTKILAINGNQVVTLADIYSGATASDNATTGLVPAATSSERNSYLRGDGTWQSISSIVSNYTTWRPIKVGGTEKLGSGTDTGSIDFAAGTGISLSWDATNKRITITNDAPDVNHNTHYTTSMYIGENNDTAANKAVTSNPYLKLFDDTTRRSTLRFVAGTGIAIKSDANGNITITNSSPDLDHNTDYTTINKGTAGSTTEVSQVKVLSSAGVIFEGGTNKFKVGDGTNYIEIPVNPSFTVTDKSASILSSLTTLATIAGTDIKAKVIVDNKAATLTTTSQTIATVAGVDITAKITNYNTDENVKLTPKTDNVDRPLMMINGGTATGTLTSTSMFSTGIYANAKNNKITAGGFIKTGSSSNYMLLGDGDHKSLDTFFYHKGFLYLNNNWDADTLSIGSWSFKSAGYGGVGSGAAHVHCLSENSIIEVFRNVLLSATAWSDLLSYRVSWDRESNSARPNGWGPWLTIARISDLPTKSSWNYDDVYSKLGHKHAYTDITGSGNVADMALVSTNTANTLQFKLLGSHAFDSTAYLPTAGGTMIGEETISATSAIKLPLRSSHGTRATVFTSSSEGVIHGGEDNASYLGANVQIGTWYGFGIYNSNGGEKAGKNTFWHDARSGNTYTWGTYYKFAKVNGTDTYTEVSYNGHKHDADYVQSVSISGNNLRITKNNSNSDLTIPYATSAGNADTVTRFKYLDNWNSSTQGDNKVYFISNTSGATGAPGACYSGVSFMTNYVGFQLCTYGGSSEDLNFRKYKDSNNGAAWTTWRTIYHSGNLPAYPTKDSWNYDDRYVTAVGNGTGNYINNLYYTKNGSNSYFTVNYATNANTATHIKLTYINSSSNLNDIANGFYYHSDLNNPANFVSYNCAFLQFSGRGGYDKFQLEFGANEERIWFRKASNNSFSSWKMIAWTSDIPTIPSTYDWSAITNKPDTATRWPSWDEVTSKPDIWSTVTITKTLKPTTSWLDTGIVTSDLGGEGLYVLTVKHPDASDGYFPSHAGLMYNYTNYTNGSMGLEIPLHYGSHHLDYGRIFLRTLLTPNSDGRTKILIRSIANYSNSHTFTFKFRRII